MTSFNKVFLTGCDSKTEWMLPWFVQNFAMHNDTPLVFADFGVSSECRETLSHLGFADIISMRNTSIDLETGNPAKLVNWFKKPKAMLLCGKYSEYTCWIDSDIEVFADISDVFDYVEPNRLGMVKDRPWTKRSGENWYNSGIVAFKDRPEILSKWAWEIEQGKHQQRGDQEVLHLMLDSPLKQMIHISEVPNEYNWLRLQIEHDNEHPKKIKTIHWTGHKGKDRIMSKMGMDHINA